MIDERPLVIYHGNCADGFSAAWCFWRKYKERADYFAGVYSKEPPDVKGRVVYLVDFSYPRDVTVKMLLDAKRITLIDHHKSALEDLIDVVPLQDQFVDLNRSGAGLAWDFLFPEEPRPLLLNHVEDRDLWRFKLANTREIQSNLFSFEYKFELWDKMMQADQVELLKMTVAGAAIERKSRKDIAELLAVCKRRMVIGGHDVPVANLPYTMSSDAGVEMGKGELFAACYMDSANSRTFSLRSSSDGLDVSEISKLYGGGGHAKASGFRVPRNHILATS